MFYKKSRAKVGKAYKWFPRAYVLRKPVDTQMLGEAISQRCTASPADVHAVLRALPEVMAGYMEAGRSIHMDGLGTFHYKLSCAGRGVDSPEEVSPQQVKSVRVQFIPSRKKGVSGYLRSLVDHISFVEYKGKEDGESTQKTEEQTNKTEEEKE
ncbi:MAG: DNA-binding protein [Bacteroides sp.]|jgi:predicted histone-like DNA-binding protein|nr:DNA-binding protein [Bacteroides sp.]MCI1681746.1 DNA-binding protein [Bacteroides sp.]